ncbi:MAG TPA: peptide chain release factor N(5)-glutamine methyltransferase [Pseudomonadales bacterium]|nr:peptide chain release factor N(5)-glutamine methyltransferase [Pseudomonadales bacterium]
MRLVKDLLQWAVTELCQSPSPKLDAEILLAFSLNKNRSFLFTWPDHRVDEDLAENFSVLIAQRKAGMPVAYLVGERGFWNLNLTVNNSTLIPRPETELLVEIALECTLATARVLDLGTGTGAIALAIAKERPQWQVDGVDRITGAIALANQNAVDNQVFNANFWPSNWFDCVQDQYDVIVSNPPYIAEDDEHLQQGDVQFEPRSALVADENGLADIRHIIFHSRDVLRPGGQLWLEHGWKQAEAVRSLLNEAGFQQVQTRPDLSGNDRVSGGVWQTVQAR